MWSDFTIPAPGDPDAVRGRLAAALARSPALRGAVRADGFEVTRRWAWLELGPRVVARGRFDPGPRGGTAVRGRTRPHPVTLVPLGAVTALCGVLLTSGPGWDGCSAALVGGLYLFMAFGIYFGGVSDRWRCLEELRRALAPPPGQKQILPRTSHTS